MTSCVLKHILQTKQNNHSKPTPMKDPFESYEKLKKKQMSPLALLSHTEPREKFIDLVLNGVPEKADQETAALFHSLRKTLSEERVDDARVVVFGGGSGLSNIIGGDCRKDNWVNSPFLGLKEVFPKTRSIVCVTDDGGSTGELLKDLPLIALGDIRHVLLSSVQLVRLQRRYNLSIIEAKQVVAVLACLFNYRFESCPENKETLITDSCANLDALPRDLKNPLQVLLDHLFFDKRLFSTLARPQCLGNLLLASAIYREIDTSLDNDTLAESHQITSNAIYRGLIFLARIMGAEERAVMPCTSTLARLRVLYTNGVQIVGESKSAESSRGYPVDTVSVDFCGSVQIYPQLLEDIEKADILIMAPGSLYSSIIPIFQVPGLADAVRMNTRALKILVANIWVQTGETDLSIADPDRKFHVSDMIRAYERNIPGGTTGLFKEILCLSLKDVSASILQNYAVEGKVPIYLDRSIVCRQGFVPIECGIFSKSAMAERGVIQHDPETLAQAVKTILISDSYLDSNNSNNVSFSETRNKENVYVSKLSVMIPSRKYQMISKILLKLDIVGDEIGGEVVDTEKIRDNIIQILWKHKSIPLEHLQFFKGIKCIDRSNWRRDQRWDKVFSFFDPEDSFIKIRKDQLPNIYKFEVAFLIALGESLLGNYASIKEVKPVVVDTIELGKVYHLFLRDEKKRNCYFSDEELKDYLILARMLQVDEKHFTRLVNGREGFTPPGLLMGLIYAWYLENRTASHVEYKMSVIQIDQTDLVPEQLKMLKRRQKMISFFREMVFPSHN